MQISQSSKLEFVRLGDYVEVKGRIGWRGLKKEEYTIDGPFMISGNNLYNRKIDWDNCLHISQFRYDESPEIKLKPMDIIMTKDGTIGRLGYIENIPSPATINSTIVLIREVSNVFFPEFLYYYFQGPRFQKIVKEKVSGLAVPHIFQRDIKELRVPKLLKEEQQKIASILSKVDELIQKTDQVIEQIQRLKKGLMQKLLTKGIGHIKFKKIRSFFGNYEEIPEEWEVVQLGDFAKIRYGLSQPPEEDKDGIPMIRATNIKRGIIYATDVLRIKSASIPKSKDVYLHHGDIIVVRSGAYTGDIGYVSKRFDRSVAGYDLIVSPTKQINSTWLVNYLLSSTIQNYFSQLKSRVAQSHLNAQQLSNTQIYLPHISEQQKIANIIFNIDGKIQVEVDQKQKQGTLKKGLMQKLLTGQIRVKV